jgi:RNA polymerase sigma factor for flagellar operon FliA
VSKSPSHSLQTVGPRPDDNTLLARARASKAYAQQSRQAAEEKWILAYLPMVRHIVQRITRNIGSRSDVEDLISAGTVGLVKAARAFDKSKDVDFKTYAYIRIRGAVIDELRGRSFVPATVHNEIRRAREAYERHLAEKGKPPGDEELAGTLGLSVAQLYKLWEEARRQNFLSIHGLSDDPPNAAVFHPPAREPSPDQQAEHKELLQKLTDAVTDLPKRDRLAVLLYYDRDLTMKEAAHVLGVTESRFSQLHARAIFRLAVKMGRKP